MGEAEESIKKKLKPIFDRFSKVVTTNAMKYAGRADQKRGDALWVKSERLQPFLYS